MALRPRTAFLSSSRRQYSAIEILCLQNLHDRTATMAALLTIK
ncbi:MAG: hypothetical protein ABSA94_11095 [Acidobacteriaceae bacterium]